MKHRYLCVIGALVLASISFGQEPAAAPEGGPRGGSGRGGRRGANRPPAGPTPRLPDNPFYGVNAGKPDFGGKGMWNVPYIIDMQKQGRSPDGGPVEVPFTADAKKIFDERTANHSKDDPEGFCLPPGVPRMMYTPYPTQIYQMADRILFIFEGGAHVWRLIWMDGRKHPDDPNPTFLGDSVGHWEGDTLVVDTVGFNERFWLSREGIPHTEYLHLIEKFTRTDSETLKYEATIDDPGAYTRPWSGGWNIRWSPGEELYEYMCQENNRDVKHMYGGER